MSDIQKFFLKFTQHEFYLNSVVLYIFLKPVLPVIFIILKHFSNMPSFLSHHSEQYDCVYFFYSASNETNFLDVISKKLFNTGINPNSNRNQIKIIVEIYLR